MSLRILGVLAVAAVALPAAAPSQPTPSQQTPSPGPVPPEFQVNSYTTSRQTRPAVAMDRAGDFVVVWQSSYQDGSRAGIFGQRYHAGGERAGNEFQVNTYTTSEQWFADVAMDPSGRFVVVWESAGQYAGGRGVFGQRYDAHGNRLGGEFQVNTHTTGLQLKPEVSADAIGNFLVVWTGQHDGDRTGVFGQRYDAHGNRLGGEFQVNSYTTDYQRYPAPALSPEGGFVVVWESVGQDGDRTGVFGRRFDALGRPLGGDFQVNSYTTDYQRDAAVALYEGGNFVVVWESYRQDGSRSGVFSQRYDSSGIPLGGELRVNTHTADAQRSPSVDSLADGGFVVLWDSEKQDGDSLGVFGREYSASGPVGDEFQVNVYTTGAQGFPSVASDSSGTFVVGWESYEQDGDSTGIFGRRYVREGGKLLLSANGQCPGPVEVTIHGGPPSSEVAVVSSANANGFVKGGELCNGVRFEIGEPFVLPPTWILVDEQGRGSAQIRLEPERCWIEALAIADCRTSGAVPVPTAN